MVVHTFIMRQEYYSIKISSVYNFSFYQDINKQTGKSNIISRKICVHIRYPEMTNTTENNYADKIKTLQYVIDICCGTFERMLSLVRHMCHSIMILSSHNEIPRNSNFCGKIFTSLSQDFCKENPYSKMFLTRFFFIC